MAGTERVFTDKMNYLADHAGYDVTLLTYEQGNHSFPYPLSSKVKHIDLNVRFVPLYNLNRIVRWIKEYKFNKLLRKRFDAFMKEHLPDIVIAPTYYARVMSLVAYCPVKTIRLLESHIDRRFILSNEPSKIYTSVFQKIRMQYDSYMVNRTSRYFDLLIALTQEDANDWSKYLRTEVIPNVVHLQIEKKHSNWNQKRVVFAGRLVEQKGIRELLKIWQIVFSNHQDWSLEIFGEGELREWLNEEIQRMGIGIHLHAPTSEILNEFCNSSIFVLPSVYEPFGLVIVEAMSCGLPVVCFDCPHGPSYIIEDGKDGYLIRDRNIQLFADRVIELMESFDLRKDMGMSGLSSSKRFGADVIMPQWINLFERLSDGRNNVVRDN